ncbi:MAG: cytochrome C [Paracoccaceae bacterium]|nr:cytochrome C [Paracoccaceae bacterium]MDG1737419.1 cytochrome C [Paracoccaceae bacterium]MDG2260313.1 cytochrome C [Paracoccaceae bacterium]
MKKILTTAAAFFVFATPINAEGEGDPAKGAKEFRKCKACHAITAPDGTAILKGGRTGPNLYAVIGRAAGSTEFTYSSIMKTAGEAGLIWDAEGFAAYIVDPNGFLSAAAGESGRSKMTKQRVKNPIDIVAYLESVVE